MGVEPWVCALPLLRTLPHEDGSTLVASEARQPCTPARRQGRCAGLWLLPQHGTHVATTLPPANRRRWPSAPAAPTTVRIRPGQRGGGGGAPAPPDRVRRRAPETGVCPAVGRQRHPTSHSPSRLGSSTAPVSTPARNTCATSRRRGRCSANWWPTPSTSRTSRSYWTAMTRLRLPRFQYTVREVVSGLAFVGYADELSKTYTTLLAEQVSAHLAWHGVERSCTASSGRPTMAASFFKAETSAGCPPPCGPWAATIATSRPRPTLGKVMSRPCIAWSKMSSLIARALPARPSSGPRPPPIGITSTSPVSIAARNGADAPADHPPLWPPPRPSRRPMALSSTLGSLHRQYFPRYPKGGHVLPIDPSFCKAGFCGRMSFSMCTGSNTLQSRETHGS